MRISDWSSDVCSSDLNKLPEAMQAKARKIGIGLALAMRLALLSLVAFIVTLTQPLFELFGHGFSWRDIILIAGGLFLEIGRASCRERVCPYVVISGVRVTL